LLTTYFSRNEIDRYQAFHFVGSFHASQGRARSRAAAGTNAEPPPVWEWQPVRNSDWFTSRGPQMDEPAHLASLRDCKRAYDDLARDFDVVYLFQAFPMVLLRQASTALSRQIATLQVLWKKSLRFERDFKSLLRSEEDSIKTKLQCQLLNELLWLSFRHTDPLDEALPIVQHAEERARGLFANPFHDCSCWTPEHLAAKHEELTRCLARLSSLPPILAAAAPSAVPDCACQGDPERCWHLAAAKALAHGAVHPRLLCWFAGSALAQGGPVRVELALARPEASQEANLRIGLRLIQAIVHLRVAERLREVSLAGDSGPLQVHLLFERRSTEEELASCVLGEGPAESAPGAETEQGGFLRKAFHFLRQCGEPAVSHEGQQTRVVLPLTGRSQALAAGKLLYVKAL
jgi:hypothetical protein